MLPHRMCIACRKRDERQNLLKIVKPKDGAPHIVLNENGQGRGAYICKNNDCVEAARKKRALSRALRCEVDEELYNQLHIIIDGGEQNGCEN